VHVVVCSDGMARGVDLPAVAAVVNYDLPAYVMTYVHRVGRTARAGRLGAAYTLLKGKSQEKQFLAMRAQLAPTTATTATNNSNSSSSSSSSSSSNNSSSSNTSNNNRRPPARHSRVTTEECEAVRGAYERSLRALKEVMEAEASGELRPLEKIRRLKST
jgi:superfamily II DNA/RNA helicase